MRVTVRQLKALIREAAQEAIAEMDEGDHNMEETVEEDTAALQEAVTKAFRAGYQRGVRAATTRRSR
jgi:hypothetical protein